MPEAAADEDDDDAYRGWLVWSNGLPMVSAPRLGTLVAFINTFPWLITRLRKEAIIFAMCALGLSECIVLCVRLLE